MEMKVGPISPDDVAALKTSAILEEVFAAFNEMIVKKWTGRAAHFSQDEVMQSVLSRMPRTSRGEIFENHWLDVEDSYRAIGWAVTYDKPGFNESGPATFTFSRRRIGG